MPTVLILEDEPVVRGVIRAILQRAGREVIVVETAEEAIYSAEQHRIDLLVADVILRDQNGPDIAGRLLALNPEMACLFISGYPREKLENAHLLDGAKLGTEAVAFLPKPFTPGELSAVCEWLLDPDAAECGQRVAVAGMEFAEARFRLLSAKIATAMTYVEIARTEHEMGAWQQAEDARARAKHVLATITRELEREYYSLADHSALRSALAQLSSALDSLWPAS